MTTVSEIEKALLPELEELLLAGAHLGYGKSTRHPKMQDFIFGSRNNIEIFDLSHTLNQIKAAEAFLKELGKNRKAVLWVGTKPSANISVESAAAKLKLPFVNDRWLGGTLTNFKIIDGRLKYWADLENELATGGFEKYVKKEKLLKMVEMRKLNRMLRGIKTMKALPDAMVIVDPKEEKTAFAEAKIKKIPVIALLNTDCNPEGVAYPIAANDNSASAIALILNRLASAYETGTKESPSVSN